MTTTNFLLSLIACILIPIPFLTPLFIIIYVIKYGPYTYDKWL